MLRTPGFGLFIHSSWQTFRSVHRCSVQVLSLDFGRASKGQAESCPEATPALSRFYALDHCNAERWQVTLTHTLEQFFFVCFPGPFSSSHHLELDKASPLYIVLITDVMKCSSSEFSQINSKALTLKKVKQTSTERIIPENKGCSSLSQ